MRTEPSAAHDRRWLILAICCTSLLIVGLDSTIVNIALPAIRRSLHASFDGLQWTIDAYTLVLASLLMLAGSTGDRLGRKRVFQTGLVVFSLGSLLCAVAPSLGLLVAARVLQAIGGSMLNPVAMSIVRNVFEDPRERATAIGLWGAAVGISMALGPVVGGLLVDSVSWRAVFLVNLPVGVAAIVLTALFVPESRAPRARRLDPVGQALMIAGLACLTGAIIEGPRSGWGSPLILVLFAVAAGCLASLVPWELRRREPLIELRFFRSVPFSSASVAAVLAFAAMGGFLFLNTIYLQDVRGLSPLVAGLYTLPMAAMMLVFAPLSGRLVAGGLARRALVGAGAAMILGSLMLTRLTVHTSATYLLAAYLVFGLGMGLVNPPITNTAVSGMPPAQAGVAAAVASTSRQVGQTLGVAVIGAVAGGSLTGAIGPDFAAQTHPAWWILIVLGAVIVGLGVVSTSDRAHASAERTAAVLEETEQAPPAPAGQPAPAAA